MSEVPTLTFHTQGSSRVPYSETMLHSKDQHYQLPLPAEKRCCDTGRPIMADPTSGHTVCSCKLKTGTQTYLNGLQNTTDYTFTSRTSPTYTTYPVQTSVSMATEPSAFYRPPTSSAVGKVSTSIAPVTSVSHHPYLDTLTASTHYHPYYPGIGFPSAAQRKVPTRETTGPLKAWLKDHKQNPYPTKGEKVMLAMVTRMTLTQVSTWFANARRRMKKDKHIDWSSGDDEVTGGEKDDVTQERETISRSSSRLSTSSTEDEIPKVRLSSVASSSSAHSSDSEDEQRCVKKAKKCLQNLFEPLSNATSSQPSIIDPFGNTTGSSYISKNSTCHSTSAVTSPENIYILPPFRSLGYWNSSTTEATASTPIVGPNAEEKPLQKEKKKIWSISEIIG